jgi:hypothetical protein
VYFLRHSAEEIAWHTRALHYRTGVEEPVVKARLNPQGEGFEVMIYTRDQRDLFARLVGFFSLAPATPSSTPRSTPPVTATRWTASCCSTSASAAAIAR